MKIRHLLPFLSLLVCRASAEPLTFPSDGFKIEPLEQPAGPPATHVALGLTMPPTEGFAANVNVMVQIYDGSLDSFIALSKTQFAKIGAKLALDKKSGDQEWIVEYTGKLPQGDLHFYARAVGAKGKIYLITATDSAAGWAKNAVALKKCVDSFALAK